MRRLALVLAVAALLAGCGSSDSTPDERRAPGSRHARAGRRARPARGAPRAGERAARRRRRRVREAQLRELRGYPVVVNKWASWCGPCRAEFPYFQRQAVKHGKRIAFLGVDCDDTDGDARELLDAVPLTYPSYKDPDGEDLGAFNGAAGHARDGVLRRRRAGSRTPIRAPTSDERKLAQDIRRYAR